MKTKKFLSLVLVSAMFVSLFMSVAPRALAVTLLSDDFTGTTIDSTKWTEVDAGGLGGTTGNIQQNGSLSMTGSAAWGQNYLYTKDTYDRSLTGLEMQADVTCASSSSIMGIGYGDPGVLTGNGTSYTMYAVSNTVYFSRQNANSNAENVTTAFTCTNGVAFHIRITIDSTSGASLYINGSGTPAATVTGGTFNNKGFFLSGHSGTATLVDNFVVNGTSAATVPDAPTGLTASPSSTQMGLSWAAPSSNGGASITDYIVEYKLHSDSSWTTFSDGTSTSTSATVTGLTNGLSYDFRVSAVNSVGTGAASSTATATPALSVPSAPQSLTATSSENSQSSLSWSAPISNGGAAITDYIVEYKLHSDSSWTTFSDDTSTSTSATVTGLTNNSQYDFRVSAVNSVGTGAVSSTISATPAPVTMSDFFTGTTIDTSKWNEVDAGGLGGTTGSVTQNGSLNIVSGTHAWSSQDGIYTTDTYDRTNGDVSMEFSVSRTACGSNVAVAAGYGDFDFTTGSSAAYIFLANSSNWEIYYWLNGSNQANSPQTLSGLTSCTNGVPITFKIVALQAGGAKVYVNGSGTASATLTGGTFTNKPFWIGSGISSGGTASYDDVRIIEPLTGPFAPVSLNATAGDGQVGLTWASGGDNGAAITDYVIQYKLSTSGSWSTFVDGTSASTSTTVTGLTNGLAYNFRVMGVNANGTSDPSSSANATPISSTPTAPTALSVAISGTASVDELLTGTYTFADANGNSEATSTYRWLRSSSAGGTYTAIPGATGISYTVTTNDIGQYLKFEVTPVASVSPTTGSPALSAASAQVAQVDYINQIVSTGQSLSVGVGGSPALTTTQPYSNVMLTGAGGGMGAGGSFTPLVESGVETMGSALANFITGKVAGNGYNIALTNYGVSGYTYSQLKKGTGPYSTGLNQVTNVKTAAAAQGKMSRVVATTSIHGETDNFNGVSGPTYEGYLVEWQHDMETDYKAITGQSGTIPFFIDQMSSYFSSYANTPTSQIPIYQYKASLDNPGKIYLVTPKYFFNYSDRHHLTAASYRWLGEYYGKVIKKVVVDHEDWRPLSPETITRSSNVIYAKFHVPAGVLAFDTTIEQAIANKGFEYFDSTSSASITSVAIVSDDTVAITLNQTPTGSNQRLRYAYTGTAGVDAGSHSAGAAGGNLRDTDPTTSSYGNTLYNWAVHFDEPITVDSTAPVISSTAASAGTTSASISWSTNEASSSIVNYGLSASYGSTTSETDTAPRVTSHTVNLPSLVACTTYHYRVRSNDATGNLATDTDHTFTTSGCTGSSTVTSSTSNPVTDSSGGNVQLTSGGTGLSLDVPAHAVGSDATFQILKLDSTSALNAVGLPNGFLAAGTHTYELKSLTGPSTAVTSFSVPLSITITYDDADVSGINETSLVIYHYSGGAWTPLTGCVVDTTANTVTCNTSSFSMFSLMGNAPASSGGGPAPAAPAVPKTPTVPSARSATGANVKLSDGTIYTITKDGTRRAYTSAAAFLSYGFNTFANVAIAQEGDLALSAGSYIPPRDGSIICSDRGSDKGTCYLITDGKKAAFTSAAVFKALGFSFTTAKTGDVSFMASDSNIDSSTEAHRKGTLVLNGKTLQLMGKDGLVGIPSMDVLASWGYDYTKAVKVNSSDTKLSQTKVLSTRPVGELNWE